MATSTLGSGTLVLAGTTSGTTTVTATAVAGTTTLTLPAATDTLVGKATTDTLTNKTLTGAAMNGTLGATTPSTVAATSISASTTLGVTGVSTLTGGAVVEGLTVGRGGAGGAANTAYGASAIPIAPNSGVVAIGSNAGKLFNTASDTGQSTFVGYFAGAQVSTGTDSTFVGGSAGTNTTTGAKNTAVGSQALQFNITASYNTAVGYQAGYNSTGGGSQFFGYLAGSNLTTGGVCLYMGNYPQASSVSVTNEIVIAVAGGGSTVGKGSSTGYINANGGGVYQGNNSASWSTTSDRRLKKNIVDNTVGLDAITAIRVRNFEYRLPEEVDAELNPTDAIQKSGVQLGVIAQELNEVLPECIKTESTGVMSVNPDNLTWYLVNAIKELKAEVDSLKVQINGATA